MNYFYKTKGVPDKDPKIGSGFESGDYNDGFGDGTGRGPYARYGDGDGNGHIGKGTGYGFSAIDEYEDNPGLRRLFAHYESDLDEFDLRHQGDGTGFSNFQ